MIGFLDSVVKTIGSVAVNSGNILGGIEYGRADICLDQIVSSSQIGDEYIFIEGNGTPEMELPLIIADQDNTEVFVNGNPIASTTLNAGDYYFVPNSQYQGTINRNIYVKTSKPVFSYQLIGGLPDTATSGLNFIPPLSCFFQESVYLPSIDEIGNANYNSDLMMLTYSTATITINGTPISTSQAQTVLGNTDWVTYRISGYTGNVNVVSTGPLTVGNERDLFRKSHFAEMQQGFRKLHFKGFALRSHHGETWHTLKRGVQAVDNSFNIWHIDTLEHGLSLGINPNYYFHSLYKRIILANERGEGLSVGGSDYKELMEMDWREHEYVREKIFNGEPITKEEQRIFVKVKFHTAREVEHYQHDVLNRMISKKISLIALPSSNNKLTNYFPDFKDHPFSWWEKKGIKLGVGTDNYITLNTNYIQELLILLFTDPENLKITKLLMVATGETRRPFLSQLLWKMRDN
jgi:hypothetical protein